MEVTIDTLCSALSLLGDDELRFYKLRQTNNKDINSHVFARILCIMTTDQGVRRIVSYLDQWLHESMDARDIVIVLRHIKKDCTRRDLLRLLIKYRRGPFSIDETKRILMAVDTDMVRVEVLHTLLTIGIEQEDRLSIITETLNMPHWRKSAAKKLGILLDGNIVHDGHVFIERFRVNGCTVKWPDKCHSVDIEMNKIYVDDELYYDTSVIRRGYWPESNGIRANKTYCVLLCDASRPRLIVNDCDIRWPIEYESVHIQDEGIYIDGKLYFDTGSSVDRCYWPLGK